MKYLYLSLFLALPFLSYGQENTVETNETTTNRKHELRLDILEAVAVPALEVNYEYVISKFSGAGAAVHFSFNDSDYLEFQKFAFTPYYRQYFFNKKDFGARGFFVEGNLRIAHGDEFFNGDESCTQFGAGFALGQKWTSRNGFVFEISAGIGRYFGSGNGPEVYPRGGFSAGYRF